MYKAFDKWLPSYLSRSRRAPATGTIDIMLAVCDHFEPCTRGATQAVAMERMKRWNAEFPRLIELFRDADNIRPRHSFFFPSEQYDEGVMKSLEDLCAASGGECELHLHHKDDTADTMRAKLLDGSEKLSRHGFLSRTKSGEVRYAFIHGNWALDNSHPQGIKCGVVNELAVLQETGCYADFTMPSAPDPTQTRMINSIYYAQPTTKPKSHDTGTPARVGGLKGNPFLLVQGPLGLNWERRKFGLLPRLENADLTGANPPGPDRMRLWMNLGAQVAGQPNWIFIKLHTHGALPANMPVLLGDPMRRFHEYLLREFNDGKKYRLHYVTAREMVNIIHAAEDGGNGDAGQFRDHRYLTARPPG